MTRAVVSVSVACTEEHDLTDENAPSLTVAETEWIAIECNRLDLVRLTVFPQRAVAWHSSIVRAEDIALVGA